MNDFILKVLQTLASNELRAATAAAQVISAIAAAELPQGQWTDLIQTLLQNVANPSSPASLKQSTLQAIGFVCEEIVR
jgi:importin subunit beta-1